MSANKPDISQIRKYLNGELDARAMHKLERQAQDDPFLMDALEGYVGRKDQQANLDDLQQRLQRRVASQSRKRMVMWPVISIAATVLVFISIRAWWVLIYQPAATKTTIAQADHTAVNIKPAVPVIKPPTPAPINSDSVVLSPTGTPLLNRKLANDVADAQPKPAKSPTAVNMMAEPNAELRIDEPVGRSDVKQVVADTLNTKLASLNDLLKNSNSGVALGQPGADTKISIRGISSFPKNPPLYVVDGTLASSMQEINPQEIASIKILKDTAATALYGSRAANGVIIITTKSGQKRLATAKKRDSSKVTQLAEVQIIGYQSQRKREVASSISSVVDQQLAGRVAGVQVGKIKRDSLLTVTGQVFSKDDGLPLPGVSVQVPGTSAGTMTDVNGKFTLRINSAEKRLKLAYVGYETQEVKVKGNTLQVKMNPAMMALNEVVVVGYGTKKAINTSAQSETGWGAFNQYLKDSAKSPDGKSGKVKVQFIVNTDNSLSDFKIVKSLSPQADALAIDLIKKGPAWQHNTNGKPETVTVKVKFKTELKAGKY